MKRRGFFATVAAMASGVFGTEAKSSPHVVDTSKTGLPPLKMLDFGYCSSDDRMMIVFQSDRCRDYSDGVGVMVNLTGKEFRDLVAAARRIGVDV